MEPLDIRNNVGRWGLEGGECRCGIVEPRSPPMALEVGTSAPRQGASLFFFYAHLVGLEL
jgi:hypothetical protein